MTYAPQAALAFIEGRRAARGFADFPGTFPTTLDEAYAIQAAATKGWGDDIAGWKVGRINGPLATSLGADRFAGPIFAGTIAQAVDGQAPFPMIAAGFGAFEAELLVRIAADAPSDQLLWSVDEARALVGALHVGVEVAGSALSTIHALGPLASIAGFGNNMALIVGPAVTDWQSLSFDDVHCRTSMNGVDVKQAAASAIPGGPFTALAFLLEQTARMGHPLRAGQWVSTGAITGVHAVQIGERWRADFGPLGVIDCPIVQASPPA